MKHKIFFLKTLDFYNIFEESKRFFILFLKKMQNLRQYFSIFEVCGSNLFSFKIYILKKKCSERIQRLKLIHKSENYYILCYIQNGPVFIKTKNKTKVFLFQPRLYSSGEKRLSKFQTKSVLCYFEHIK